MKWGVSKTIAVTLLCILQFEDYASTLVATSVPHVVELNPIINAASAAFGFGGLILVKLTAAIIAFVVVRRANKMWLVWTAIGIYAVIVSSNIILAGC